jgi:hypothetical protein
MKRIESRRPREQYDAIKAVSVTRLKELKRSPQHYAHFLEHPKRTDALTLGTATHVAVLEPERFSKDFAIWNRRTEADAMAPRRGKAWDEFCNEHAGKTILTADEATLANDIAKAVRFDETANAYLASGDPEVTLEWDGWLERACKGRVDWVTTSHGHPTLVGLKTARDCRPFIFGAQAAKLEYGMQWAFYHDGYEAITGKSARMIEIVVESAPPHAVATYAICEDIILQGRDNYRDMLKLLLECECNGEWPGPVKGEQVLTLPSWYYPSTEDISELDLEPIR